MKEVIVVIMAGGLGKRMESDLPKVLHKINGIPMLVHILFKIILLRSFVKVKKVLIVVGKYRSIIEECVGEYIDTQNERFHFVDQPEALGTGHAVQCCRDELLKYVNSTVLVLSGDTPLLSVKTMVDMVHKCDKCRIMTAIFENSRGYGRIVEKYGVFERIVEEKDCTEEEREIKKVNCGIYAFDCEVLAQNLPYLTNNNKQNEYYLTDIIEIIKRNESTIIEMMEIKKEYRLDIMGVNTKEQLDELERIMLTNTSN